MATSIAIGFTYTNQAPLVPLLRDELGLTEAQIGLFPTALFLISMLSMLVLGNGVDRYGSLRLNGAALLFATVGNGLFALAPTFETLLAAKAITGIAGGIGFAGIRYISGLYGDGRPHFGQGIYGAGFPVGSALGIAVMPPLANLTGGWRGAFAASTLVLLAVLLCWMAFAPKVHDALSKAGLRVAIRNGNVWWTFLHHAAGFGLMVAVSSWIAVFLIDAYGLSIVTAGLIGSLLPMAGLITRPLGGWLVATHRVATVPIMRFSQALNVTGLLLLALPERPFPLALAGVAALGIGTSLSYAAVFNTASASLPTASAAAQSLTGIGGNATAIIGPPLIGLCVQQIGFGPAWFAIAFVPALAFIGTFVMRGEEGYATAAIRPESDRAASRPERL